MKIERHETGPRMSKCRFSAADTFNSFDRDLELAVTNRDGALAWPSSAERKLRGTKPQRAFRQCALPSEPRLEAGRKVMDWFSGRTSIAGVQLPNWLVVLGAIVLILLIYASIH